jgi:hypothetical protein
LDHPQIIHPEMPPAQLTACVTGATGYVASELIRQLLVRGYAVKATVRCAPESPRLQYLRDLAERSEGSLQLVQVPDIEHGSEALDSAVQGVSYVFHVASPFRFDGENSNLCSSGIGCKAGSSLQGLSSNTSQGFQHELLLQAAGRLAWEQVVGRRSPTNCCQGIIEAATTPLRVRSAAAAAAAAPGDPQLDIVQPAVEGTKTVLQAAAKQKASGLQRVVVTSSVCGEQLHSLVPCSTAAGQNGSFCKPSQQLWRPSSAMRDKFSACPILTYPHPTPTRRLCCCSHP